MDLKYLTGEADPPDEATTIKLRLDALEAELASANEKIEALVIANNAFRTAMLTRSDPPTIDSIYLARARNSWATFDITVLMQFYEIFSSHHQIFNDLIIQKKGRNAISEHILAKAAANAEEVKNSNFAKDKKSARSVASAAREAAPELSEADRNKKKALQGLMKSLNLNEAAARAMLDGMAK